MVVFPNTCLMESNPKVILSDLVLRKLQILNERSRNANSVLGANST